MDGGGTDGEQSVVAVLANNKDKLADLKVSESLEDVRGPMDNIPEEARIINFECEGIPRLFSPHHCIELKAKIWIMKAVKCGYDYLKRPTWTPSLECPKFPRDNKNVSPKKTPESINVRPCWIANLENIGIMSVNILGREKSKPELISVLCLIRKLKP